jgi:hypothetical protein
LISDEIRSADTIEQLTLVVSNHGGDFSFVNAAAAISKAAKVPGNRSKDAAPLLTDLLKIWWQQLPEAQMRQCANVLWALARLGIADTSIWGMTLDAFLYQLQRNLLAYDGVGHINAQEISMVIWACAKAGRPLDAEQVELLLQAFTQPAVLAAAAPQAVSNVVWGLSELHKLPSWDANTDCSAQVKIVLGDAQVRLVAVEGASQAVANVVLGLARISCKAFWPLISTVFAENCLRKTLEHVDVWRLERWAATDVAKILWACGQLRVCEPKLLKAVALSASTWLSAGSSVTLGVVAWAFARLRYKDLHTMKLLVQQSSVLLQRSTAARGRGTAAIQHDEAVKLVSQVSWSLAQLDLQALAGDIPKMLLLARVANFTRPLPDAAATQLLLVHNWLVQNSLGDGRGLLKVLTRQQMQQCVDSAAAVSRP